jgi:hypothetical protein
MARKGQPKPRREERPPPLPPETRTVGQLVAESVRLYARRFWPSLALGIGPAVVTVASYEVGWRPSLAAVAVAYLVLMTASYIGACVIASGARPSRSSISSAFGVGVLVLLPTLALAFALGLLALAWLALAGLAVPVAVLEGRRPAEALRRGVLLGRVDYVHALGSLCALALVVFLTQFLLFSLLHGASKQGVAIAGFLASLIISPVLFLGAALLYYDQAARLRFRSTTTRRKPDAHLPDAVDTH